MNKRIRDHHSRSLTWSVTVASAASVMLSLGSVCADPVEDRSNAIFTLGQAYWDDLRETSYVTGFAESRVGTRLQDDPFEDDLSMGDLRLQLDYEGITGPLLWEFTGDFIYDNVLDGDDVDLEAGKGWFDLRTASVSFTPVPFVDVKLGRQVLTWGTGDLLFINDLFPKDWNAFFIGRDEEYLKAPSDSLKISLFSDWVNLDVVYTPRFDTNRFPDNRRISQWNAVANRQIGDNVNPRFDTPDDWFKDDEIALRLYRIIRGYEGAIYAYHGFWKDPKGFDLNSGRATFPELTVFGASLRGTFGPGIGNVEFGYYDSGDDRSGNNNLIPNSQVRFLAGYEQEIARELTAGIQYYLEYTDDYGAYKRNQPTGNPLADYDRHVVTLRLTKLLLRQTLALSLFTYWSPSDKDAYLRPNIHYKVSDKLGVEVGGNIFLGEETHTFFGQFDKNTNVYGGIRYSL